jgi:hypothetical protein
MELARSGVLEVIADPSGRHVSSGYTVRFAERELSFSSTDRDDTRRRARAESAPRNEQLDAVLTQKRNPLANERAARAAHDPSAAARIDRRR